MFGPTTKTYLNSRGHMFTQEDETHLAFAEDLPKNTVMTLVTLFQRDTPEGEAKLGYSDIMLTDFTLIDHDEVAKLYAKSRETGLAEDLEQFICGSMLTACKRLQPTDPNRDDEMGSMIIGDIISTIRDWLDSNPNTRETMGDVGFVDMATGRPSYSGDPKIIFVSVMETIVAGKPMTYKVFVDIGMCVALRSSGRLN